MPVNISAVFGNRQHFDSQRVFWKKTFLAFKEAHSSKSITCKIFEPSSWSFFSKCAKFHGNFKNGIKKRDIVFAFSDNFVSTGCWNFCQLWGEYMWSTVNMLTNRLYSLDLIKRDVFQLKLSRVNTKLG